MTHQHVPRSAIAPDPKLHKYCHHCGNQIALQRQWHRCTDLCTDTEHTFGDAELHTIARYWDDQFNEMCEECAKKPPEARKRHGM